MEAERQSPREGASQREEAIRRLAESLPTADESPEIKREKESREYWTNKRQEDLAKQASESEAFRIRQQGIAAERAAAEAKIRDMHRKTGWLGKLVNRIRGKK